MKVSLNKIAGIFTPRRTMMRRIDSLRGAIQSAENKHVKFTGGLLPTKLADESLFMPKDAGREAVHVPTKPEITVALFDQIRQKMPLPKNINLIDLGSGLGSFASSASIYLDHLRATRSHVTGVEISPSVFADSVRIAKEQGVSNISYVNGDFALYTKDDLRPYNMLYIYRPFNENFSDVMDEVFLRTAPGTILITRLCSVMGILRFDSLFKPVFSPFYENHGNEYIVYIRTNEEKRPEVVLE